MPTRGIQKLFAFLVLLGFTSLSQAAVLVHEFYLPMPEAQIRQAYGLIETNLSTTLDSAFSVVVTGDGTVVYYDQWEDGYEIDLSHPVQSTTQVWGDGNNANGIAPGFTNDPVGLPAGTVLTLRNLVPLPRNPSTILFDARDRIAATKALVVSRFAWPTTPGPVMAGAAEVPATIDYGTNYISPVGQDLTNKLFQYVGLFVMAGEDGTTATIDADGSGASPAFSVLLNRGESYLVNGGVKKGGSITATKPVQANLLIGHIGAHYAADWFALRPVSSWSSIYYTPVSTSSNNNPAYVYLYNSNPGAITINFATLSGSGSFSVGSGATYQFQMPKGSGAKFTSAGGQKYFALCTAGANPSSDAAYNWGFSLLPGDSLTTEAVVGWGPGSSDGTKNGSPVWVTPAAATRVYVDYNGDRAGPLTDPNGNKYDVHFDLPALASKTIYDPDRDQTAMRLYTLDGTVISAVWGEDPAVAASGNPYIDAGTAVLPFPVPVLTKTSVIVTDTPPSGLSIGDTVEYTITLNNRGLLPLGNTVVLDAPPASLAYLPNSTTLDGNPIPDSISGTPFPLDNSGYSIPIILRDGTSTFKFRATVLAAGSISNFVNAIGYGLSAQNVLNVPPPGGSTPCNLIFSDGSGTSIVSYAAGAGVYLTMADADANTSSNTIQTLSLVVSNLTRGDLETITLTETGVNTGVFRNSSALPSSLSSGVGQQDGVLNVAPGDILAATYRDPLFGDVCNASVTIQVAAQTKVLYLSDPNQALDRIDPVATGDLTTAQTVDLGSAGGVAQTIGVDATSTGNIASGNLTISHTTGAGANRLMLVGVSFDRDASSVSNITYNGVSLALVTNQVNSAGSTKPRIEIWRLLNPPSGTFNVVVTFNGPGNAVAGVITFTNVDQATPFGAIVATQNGTPSSPASATLSSAAGEMIFDTVSLESSAVTPGGNQTLRWSAVPGVRGAGSTAPGAASVTMSWTNSSVRWAQGGVAIRPATSGGFGTNFTTFAQSPAFCQNFALTSGGTVSVTNFVTVTAGSMPANPNITASLKYGGTTFLTLSNPVYSGTSSNLVWSGTVSSNVTIPSGQALSYSLSNYQSGVGYRLDYDSASKPAKITLPTTTVIHIGSLGVYDAAYPAGNLAMTPANGSTLYVRISVSDPFGSYDISSVGLNVDGPGTNDDVTTTLTGPNVVADDGCTRTYEYVWFTGSTPGNYAISATAHEGTEGITDVAAAGVTLAVLDSGTPSAAVFTSGSNGAVTNSYGANQSVCVRITDVDQNTNASVVETLTAVVTSSSGDSETVSLTETGPNSGVFVGCISASTSSGGGTNNGTLNAPVGAVLELTYTDPNDPSDTSSASATVLPPPGVASVKVNKTLVTPADGQAGLGESVEFAIQVINNGNTNLNTIALTDSFPAAALSFVSASLTPNTIGSGTLTWTNVGPLSPGQTTNITVSFTASGVAAPAINIATANGGGTATNSGSAGVTITHAALTITKTILSPTNGTAFIGSNAVFRITVQNTGDTPISTLPLEDGFSAGCYQFVSATIAPDGVGAGSLLWTNLASGGPLAPGGSLTLDVTLKVVGGCDPANNTAHADYAVDSNGDPVPPATSTVGLSTAASKISGTVYNDADQSGTLTAGDTGLSGVTIELFTDPNADGNPSDGTLVQITTTDPAGFYELLNLSTGAYVVVETDLPGYASTAPLNNRLPVVINSLSTNANNNFFDYLPSPVVYGTIGGTVWNDANTNGTVDVGETGIPNVTIELIQDLNTNGFAEVGEPLAAATTTDANGAYLFQNVIPGHYVVRETDSYGYLSTADTQPPNDNQIALNIVSGTTTNGNDFLDYFTGNNPGNDPPVAANDSYSTAEDTSLVIAAPGVLANDSDIDSDPLTAVLVIGPAHGILTLNSNGGFSYTPAANYNGPDSFTYVANDGTTNSGIATVFISISAVNDPPVANGQNVSTPEDTPKAITLTGSDVDNDPLTFSIVTGPTNGILSGFNPNTGAVSYTPSTNFNGGDSFTFRINDGQANSALATVAITVTPVNDAPVANSQNVSTPQNTPRAITLTGSDVDNDPLTFAIVTSPTNGTLSGFNPNTGAVTYTPNTNFNGADSFTFRVNDGQTNSGVATVAIIVNFVNTPPVANGQSVATPEDTAKAIALTGSDLDNDSLTFVILTAPTNGTLTGFNTNTGAITYTPSTNFNGGDSFTFRVNDGQTNSGVATVAITVTPVNDAPVANGQSVTTAEDTPKAITLTGSDVENDPLTFAIVTGPTNGTLSGFNTNTGAITYTPNTNFNGGDSFTFRVNDGQSNSSTATVVITVTPLNDAPVADNQNVSTPRNTPHAITLTGSDVENDPLTFAIVTSPTNGTLNGFNPNTGAITYTPNTNFSGADNFTFRVNDGQTNSAVATVAITVDFVNTPPIANGQSVTTPEDTSKAITLTGSDGENDPLTFAIVTGPTNGILSGLNPNTGAVTYTPNTNFYGGDSFTFQVNDGQTNSALATVVITVTPVNDAPVANGQSVITAEDTPKAITLTGTDVDNDPITFAIVTGPTNGTLSGFNTNTGAVTYTPSTNFNGGDSFTFRVNDGQANSSTAAVTITVTPVNDAPFANGQSVTTAEDTPKAITLTGTDVDNDPITFAIVTGPTNGTLSGFNTNTGAVTYTPSTNFNGGDSFTFRVNDGQANSSTAAVTITVTPVNDAPFANGQSVTTAEDTPKAITLTGTDVDNDPITFAIVTGPTNGTLSGFNTNTGAVTYTPSTNFNGGDSFTFRVNDGQTNSGVATVAITITPVNDAPVANGQIVTTAEDTPKAITLTGTDVENDPLTFAIVTGPTNGTLSGFNTNTGAITYTPSTNFNGGDSFTFRVNDGQSNSSVATVAITVTPVNDAPVANGQSVTTAEDTAKAITLVGSDVDNDPLTFAIVTGPTNGTLSGFNTNTGAVTYTPSTNFNGGDTFTFRVNDGQTNSGVATVAITVTPVNDAPVANGQSVTTVEDTPKAITLTGSDVENDPLTFTIVTGPTNGTLSGLNPSTGAVNYTPSTNFNGGDSFTFRVNDGQTNSPAATVAITVTPVNDAPVANGQSVTTAEDTPKAITLTGSDVENDPLTFAIVTGPTNGALSGLNPSTGAVTYTPGTNFNGADSFTFRVNDGQTNSGVATVAITVTPVNDAPVANGQSVTTAEDTPKAITLTGSDVENDPLTFTIVTGPTNGTLSGLNPNTGAVTYTPSTNFNGGDSFTFRVNDGQTNSPAATVAITVTPVNDAPIAVNDSYGLNKSSTLTVPAPGVLTNDIDVDNDPLTAIKVTNPSHGTLALNTNGGFVYTPVSNYFGSDSFTYRATDGTATSAVATVSLTITNINSLPVVGDDTFIDPQNAPLTLPFTALLTNDYDPDGDTLTITFVSTNSAQSGKITTTTTNLIYTPATNYLGTDTFFYAVSDGHGGSATGTVSIVLTAAQFGVHAGSNVFNPQTGLFEESVTVTNIGASTAAAIRLLVTNINSTNGVPRTNVYLYNATGTNSGVPYVQYNAPLDPGQTVNFTLEFYVADRRPFTNSFVVQEVLPASTGTNAAGGVPIDREFMDLRIVGSPRFVIEFTSIPGRSYTVLYSSTFGNWKAATPSITANATKTQWYDDGPPKTDSQPLSATNRFYRVLVAPSNP